MSILVDGQTRVLVAGITGAQAKAHVRFMKEYGTHVVAGVSPGKGGQTVEGVPVYHTIRSAVAQHQIDVASLFIGAPNVLEAALEAIDNGVPMLIIHEDGVPQYDTALLLQRALAKGTRVIGPNSQGIVSPGKAKIGGSGGNITEKVFTPGPVGVVSRSGGMGVEICLLLSSQGIGQSTMVAIGGDLMIGQSFVDMLREFERDAETKAVVLYGETGGRLEEDAAEFICAGGFTKPVVALILGAELEKLPREMSFGHTRALISRGEGSVTEKRRRLEEAGVLVASRFADVVPLVRHALHRNVVAK